MALLVLSMMTVMSVAEGGTFLFSHQFSGNIIEQTRSQAESTKNVLKYLAKNEKATQYVENAIESNSCLNNLDDAIEAIEATANLVDKSSQKTVQSCS